MKQNTTMSEYILYNTIKADIVNFLTFHEILESYIINTNISESKENIFCRNTKFSLFNMLAFMIMPRAESTAVELANFASISGCEHICKQTFFKKRIQLSDTIFDYFIYRWNMKMYSSSPVLRTWHGFFIIALDGTTIKLPATPEIKKYFGINRNQKGEYGYPLAVVEVAKDVLNGNILDCRIGTHEDSERMMAKDIIDGFSQDFKDQFIAILDRGYIGIAMFLWMQLSGIQYVVRLKKGAYKEVDAFFESNDQYRDVLIEMGDTYWKKGGKKSFENYGLEADKCPQLMLHLVKCKLDTGENEVLAVNLKGELPTPDEVRTLYGLRWRTETTIDELKNQLQLEIFSGNTPLTVKQDIKSKILAYNIGIEIANQATSSLKQNETKEAEVEKEAAHKQKRVKVNLNIGWHYIKIFIVKLLLSDPNDINEILTDTVIELKSNVEEYELNRHLPHKLRSGPNKGKYITYTNYKRAI